MAPDGSEIRLLADARHGGSTSSLVEVTLGSGEVSRPVRHRTVEEVWYVLEGSGKVWRCPPDAAPESVTLIDVTPGDALVIPTSWSFQFSAGPDSPLRFLCHTTPPWPGDDETVPVAQGGLGESTV
jgi:mannose-6-phosphate isomerase-like protein (cupin superfamily)